MMILILLPKMIYYCIRDQMNYNFYPCIIIISTVGYCVTVFSIAGYIAPPLV